MKRDKFVLQQFWRILSAMILFIAVDPFLATGAKAANAIVDGACGEQEFDDALAFVQSSGGGTIRFNCEKEPFIIFTGVKSINSNVTIDGDGLATLSGDKTTYLFLVNGTLNLKEITISEGYSSGLAGAIMNHGSLNILDSIFEKNSANGSGGAIYNEDSVTIEGSQFLENSALSGGAISGPGSLEVLTSYFLHNSADGIGGAIFSAGPLTINHCEFAYNESGSAGAVYIPDYYGYVVSISYSSFHHNQAKNITNGKGGALLAWSGQVTILDTDFYENSAKLGGGAIHMATGSWLNMQDSSLTENSTTSEGGALYLAGTSVITDTKILSNTSKSKGAGIFNSGSLSLHSGVVSLNIANGLHTFENVGSGGGIYNNTEGDLALTNSSITDNTAYYYGGGVYSAGEATIINSTFTRNKLISSEGSGIALYLKWHAFINFTTFENNYCAISPAAPVGTIFVSLDAPTQIKNSIVQSASPACVGSLISFGYNITSDNSCSLTLPSDKPNTDPKLGLWQDAEGALWYTMPLPGSPAVDSGNCVVGMTDQRGVSRPQGAACDIGAIERAPGDPSAYLYLPLANR